MQFVDRSAGGGRRGGAGGRLGRSKTSLGLTVEPESSEAPARLSKAERAARSASVLDRLVNPHADQGAPPESDGDRRSRLSASSSFLLELSATKELDMAVEGTKTAALPATQKFSEDFLAVLFAATPRGPADAEHVLESGEVFTVLPEKTLKARSGKPCQGALPETATRDTRVCVFD